MLKKIKYVCAIMGILFAGSVYAKDIVVTMYDTSDGKSAGTVTISANRYGLLFTPNLQGLTPGLHGFHIHENPSCDDKGMAAGGHFDPEHTKKHLGPFVDHGHMGDLPALFVNADGTVTLPVLAPKLKSIPYIKKHALMVHADGDNYSDTPAPLGGGGGRMVCGVITIS